jgi:precorrin-2 dehydrogenase/sirohydrochlorin ferrochelatase
MRYYPVFLDLKGVSCLVIGGGLVGERKVKTLQSCGARVFMISRELTPFLEEEARQGRITLLAQDYDSACLQGMFLVIGATDDSVLNEKIGREARERGLLCNVADKPADCNFILPSLVRRGDLTIAISTAGNSPALAKKIRQDMEKEFPEIYGPYLEFLGRIRREVLNLNLSQEENGKIFEALVQAPVLSWLEQRDSQSLLDLMDQLLGPLSPKMKLTGIIRQFFPSPQ